MCPARGSESRLNISSKKQEFISVVRSKAGWVLSESNIRVFFGFIFKKLICLEPSHLIMRGKRAIQLHTEERGIPKRLRMWTKKWRLLISCKIKRYLNTLEAHKSHQKKRRRIMETSKSRRAPHSHTRISKFSIHYWLSSRGDECEIK